MKFFVKYFRKTTSQKIHFPDGYIYVYEYYEGRWWWELWKWMREPYKYLDIEVVLWDKKFIQKDEALTIFRNEITPIFDLKYLDYVRVFTQAQFIKGDFHKFMKSDI